MKKGRVYVSFKPATSNQQPATSNQQPATSNQQPATSNQQPATSNQRKLGFTLSELLVSLAVLGLIAGLTVPSIVVSVQASQNRAKMKEAFQVISTITQQGFLNGDFDNITTWNATTTTAGSIVDYITNKSGLVFTKQCLLPDVTSKGCNLTNSVSNLYLINNVNARWILPNGVLIIAHCNGWNDSGIMPWTIITDTEKPIVMGSTAIHIQCNTGGIVPGSYNAFWDWDSSQLKPGMCGTPGRPIYDTYFKTGLGLT